MKGFGKKGRCDTSNAYSGLPEAGEGWHRKGVDPMRIEGDR